MEDIQKFVPLWGEWEIKELQGQGAFGSVYRAEKKQFGRTYVSAIKHLSIPRTPMEAESLVSEGIISEPSQISRYYNSLRDSIIKEIDMCYTLKGYTNIVSYEDHLILPKKDIFGYDIFIRMEYLTALTRYITLHTFTERDILRLGIDICTALEVLFQRNIIHRDIKPANVFVNDMGDFKLGDFGESRMMSHTATRMSIKGTYSYMSPEVAMGRPANITADIYSLGIMLYRLMNNNRLPFLSDGLTTITNKDIEKANVLRFSGKRLSLPVGNGNSELVNIIMRACEFQPKDRWQTPTEMKRMLEAMVDRLSKTSESIVLPRPNKTTEHSASYSVNNSVYSVQSSNSSSASVYSLKQPTLQSEKSVSVSQSVVSRYPGKERSEIQNQKSVVNSSAKDLSISASQMTSLHSFEPSIPIIQSVQKPYSQSDVPVKPKKPSSRVWIMVALGSLATVLAVVGVVLVSRMINKSQLLQIVESVDETSPDVSVEDRTEENENSSDDPVDISEESEETSDDPNESLQAEDVSLDFYNQSFALALNCMVICRDDGTVSLKYLNDVSWTKVDEASNWTDITAVSAGFKYVMGLKNDHTVVAVGDNHYGKCNVSTWRDVIKIDAGYNHAVGLDSGGKVLAVGENDEGQCNVSGWSGIKEISAGRFHTVGLQTDGTVRAVGNNNSLQCDVSGWSDIVSVSAGYFHTVGLKKDGTVVAVGRNDEKQCEVSDWTDIVAISAGKNHTIALKSDGTVLSCGDNTHGQCDVGDWTDICAISANKHYSIGIRNNNTIEIAGCCYFADNLKEMSFNLSDEKEMFEQMKR